MGKRRSSIPKVRQRQKDPRNVIFKNKKIESSWNKDKTVLENYKSLGLQHSVNDICGSREFSKRINQWQINNTTESLSTDLDREEHEILDEIKAIITPFQTTTTEGSILDSLEVADKSTKSKLLKPLTDYFINLKQKYGIDFKKMAFDIELNYNQLTEAQLRRVFNNSE